MANRQGEVNNVMRRNKQHNGDAQTGSSSATPGTCNTTVAAAIGIAILSVSYYSLTWKDFIATVDFCSPLFCDFVDYYYPMGQAVFHTGLPVEGFLYSPFNAILLAVFPLLGLDLSLVLWGILQVIVIMLYVLLFYRLVPAKLPIHLLFVSLTLFSYPLWLNFLAGNTSAFITVAILGLLVMIERKRYIAAANLLAFAASFKFYPIVFLAPSIATRNVRNLLLATAACITLLFVIPGGLLGLNHTAGFYRALFEAFGESDWVAANPHSQFFPHFVLRLAGLTGVESPTTLLVLHIVSYCIAALNLVFLYLLHRVHVARAYLWSFQILFLTVPFVLKTSWPIDFAFLPFIQTFLIWHILEGGSDQDTCGGRTHHKRRPSLLYLVLPSILISNVVFFNLLGDFALYGYYGFLFIAAILLLIAFYVELLPAVWQSRTYSKAG
jgi:hypothetical protein